MATTETTYHVPVLLRESVDGLEVKPGGVYVDVTFGGGGHSKEILRRLNGTGRLFGFDQDADVLANVAALNAENFTFERGNFRYLRNFLRYEGVSEVDGVLADLGVSSHHFDSEERGFSFRFEGKLDMRMNRGGGQTAADVVNTYDEQRLADIFWHYGELRQSRRLAKALVAARSQAPIQTVEQFLLAVRPLLGRDEKKLLPQVFQALRIEVNGELEALSQMLSQAVELLKPGGRLSVITYHSLEDRLVKNLMRTGNVQGVAEQDFFGRKTSPLRVVNSKVIVADAEEQARNPRSRSAKLRIAEKVAEQ